MLLPGCLIDILKSTPSPTQLTASDPASVLERSAICIRGVSSRPPSHHTCSASYTTPCCPCPMSPPAPRPLSPGPLPSPLTGLLWASSQQSARDPPERACETHLWCCPWPLGGPSRGPSSSARPQPHWPFQPSSHGTGSFPLQTAFPHCVSSSLVSAPVFFLRS